MWTNIPKPTSSVWSNANVHGKEQYDQSDITYDDSSTFYDGVNPNAWTNLSKPVSSVWTKINKPT